MILEEGYRFRAEDEVRGINEAYGLGLFGQWIPILRGVELKRPDADDAYDMYNEYAHVWVSVDPDAKQPVMISVSDNHGREGFFALDQSLPELLERLQSCSLCRFIKNLRYAIYYG
jgi:hypothetical protein